MRTIICGEYEFRVLANYYSDVSVLVDRDAPIHDKAYLKALRQAWKLLPHVQAVCTIEDFGGHWQSAALYDLSYANKPEVILTIEAYEKKLIPVTEEIYHQALAIRNRIPKPPKAKALPLPKPKKAGYVYLIQSPSGHYKIGRAIDPSDRLGMFGVKLPFEVELICLIKSDDYIGLEKEIHSQFDARRVNGEWFNLSAEDVEYIKSLAVES
jgi:hypothetical protein